jgi:hypothetical protein
MRRKDIPPPWFANALAAAKHQDELAAASWIKRTLHRLLASRRCPCCQYTKANNRPMKLL